MRLTASLKAKTVPPSVMLKKLSAHKRQNRLDFALQEIGRIERALFTLDWLESKELPLAAASALSSCGQISAPPPIRHGRPTDPHAPPPQAGLASALSQAIIGSPDTVRMGLAEFVGRTGADDLVRAESPAPA